MRSLKDKVAVITGAGSGIGRAIALLFAGKFALVGYTETLRMEYAPLGIGVTVVCPGTIDTNVAKDRRGSPS